MTKHYLTLGMGFIILTGAAGCQRPVGSQVDNHNSVPSFLPETPQGYQWVKVESMSDEFNQDSLNTDKWRDHITTWKGRPPAEFLPSNVRVNNGNLELKTSSHPDPSEKYSMGGSAVSGRTSATFGYYEARIKASKTKMSTTFWLHSDVHDDRHLGCGKHHAIELDILETIGGWPESYWANVMRSNSHYKPTQYKEGRCTGAPYLSKGAKHDSGSKLSDGFNTFSMWWVTPNQMHFYFNGQPTGTVDLDHAKDPLPFDSEMSLRMVVETYDWQPKFIPDGHQPYPNLQELDDATINTAYYDHVRSYQLQPTSNNRIQDGGFEQSTRAQNWQLSAGTSAFTNSRELSYTNAWGLLVNQDGQAKQSVQVDDAGNYKVVVYAKNLQKVPSGTLKVLTESGDILGTVPVTSENFAMYQLDLQLTKGEKVIVQFSSNDSGKVVFDNVAMIPG